MSNSGKIQHIDASGKTHDVSDTWWEEIRRDYENAGVPDAMVRLARPLLDGTPKQQRLAHRLLMEESGTNSPDPQAMGRLTMLLNDEHLPVAAEQDASEDDFLDAWDDFSGPASGPKSNRYTHNTSEAAARNPYAQGMPNKAQTGGGLHSGPGVED